MAPARIDTDAEKEANKRAEQLAIETGPTPSETDRKERVRFPVAPSFKDAYEEREYLKGRLAAAFRVLGQKGFDEGVAGHITMRDPVDTDTFWVNPFGVAFSLMKRSDLIRVDHDGNIIDGGPIRLLNASAYLIHSAIHKARPDVNAACHTHSIYGRSFCTLGKPLDIITQDACAFYDDHVAFNSFTGIVLDPDEGRKIATALGSKKAALLQNHGLLTVADTVEAAVFWYVSLEKCCQAQLLADAAAAGTGRNTIKVADEDAAFTYRSVGTPKAGYFSAKPMFDVIHKETGGDYLE